MHASNRSQCGLTPDSFFFLLLLKRFLGTGFVCVNIKMRIRHVYAYVYSCCQHADCFFRMHIFIYVRIRVIGMDRVPDTDR